MKVVELKTAGLTYEQVADELGYTSRGTAHNVVAKALREQTAEAVGSATAIVQIVKARVHLNGLQPAPVGLGATSAPRTLVVPSTA